MKPFIVANWKCNPATMLKARALFDSTKRGVQKIRNVEVVICPPFVYLSQVGGLALGAQDCFWEKDGAYTGEISPAMLKNVGCHYVLVGHSERRRYGAETEEVVHKKLKAALAAQLDPILCIGETGGERKKGEIEKVLRRQLTYALKGIAASLFSRRGTIAYEPLWAIGTGDPCDIDEAQRMSLTIVKIVTELYNSKTARTIRILYGGSVTSKNAAGYIKEAGMQGLLIGGASLDAKEFVSIVKAVV